MRFPCVLCFGLRKQDSVLWMNLCHIVMSEMGSRSKIPRVDDSLNFRFFWKRATSDLLKRRVQVRRCAHAMAAAVLVFKASSVPLAPHSVLPTAAV